MSEIDDIFARLGGGPSASTEQRDRRTIPRRGKAGGNRVVEVVHLTAGRPGVRTAVPRRAEPGVRAQTWEGGFPTKSTPQPSSPSPEPVTAMVPEKVGHMVMGREPVAEVVLNSFPAPAAAKVQPGPVAETAAHLPTGATGKQQRKRLVADPFDPDDERANCLRCGYAVDLGRERRGFMTCAECAA